MFVLSSLLWFDALQCDPHLGGGTSCPLQGGGNQELRQDPVQSPPLARGPPPGDNNNNLLLGSLHHVMWF